jgi:hypothetical protein
VGIYTSKDVASEAEKTPRDSSFFFFPLAVDKVGKYKVAE